MCSDLCLIMLTIKDESYKGLTISVPLDERVFGEETKSFKHKDCRKTNQVDTTQEARITHHFEGEVFWDQVDKGRLALLLNQRSKVLECLHF